MQPEAQSMGRRLHRGVLGRFVLSLTVAAMFAITVAVSVRAEQDPATSATGTPPLGTHPCVDMLDPETIAVDNAIPALAVAALVEEVSGEPPGSGMDDRVTLSWPPSDAASGALCVWVQEKPPGYDAYHPSVTYVLFPDSTAFTLPAAGNFGPGEYCWRAALFFANETRGPLSEVCATVTHPALPEVPGLPEATPVAPEAGTGTVGPGSNSQLILAGLLGLGAGALALGPGILRRRGRGP